VKKFEVGDNKASTREVQKHTENPKARSTEGIFGAIGDFRKVVFGKI
jgi:hypothetical protein